MDYKYKAFISYRHSPYDMAVAQKLHRFLETFRIPDKLKKQEEKWTIFRDQDELPICSDLSDHIKTALQQSEYLIVICSLRLNASKWCREEIQYFKELHNGSTRNIVAVLIDGTPAECFPKELLESRDDGITREVEPLAANIVSSGRRQAFRLLKTEYLRLAACMLGCNYDKLYQREHRRQQRARLTIAGLILSVLTVIAAVSIYSAVTIYNQNQALLYERAEFITMQSQMLWQNGKPIEAIRLLLDVLPEEGDDRPVNVNAEYVLSQQIGAYETETFLPVKALEHQSQVSSMHYVGKGNVILTSDNDNIYFWSRDDYSLLRKYTADEFGSHRLALYVEEKPYANAELVYTGGEYDTFPGQVTRLYGECEIEYGDQVDPAIFMYDDSNVWRLDGETAEILWHHAFDRYLYEPAIELTAEGLLIYAEPHYGDPDEIHCILDPETGALTDLSGSEIPDFGAVTCGNWIIRREVIDSDLYLVCSDTETGETIWRREIPDENHYLNSVNLNPMLLIEKEHADNYADFVTYAFKNQLWVLEAETGKTVAEYPFQNRVRCVHHSENGLLFLTDGSNTDCVIDLRHITEPFGDTVPSCYVTNTFVTDTDLIARYEGEYLTWAGDYTEVYVYQERANPDYEVPFENAQYILNPSGTHALMSVYNEDTDWTQYIVDMETMTPLYSLPSSIPGDAFCNTFLDDSKCVLVLDDTTVLFDIMEREVYSILPGTYYEVSHDGKWLINYNSQDLTICDPDGNQYTWYKPEDAKHYSLSALSGDARYVCFDYTDPDTGETAIALYHMTEGTTIMLAEKDQYRMDRLDEIIWLTDTEVAITYDDDVMEIYDVEKRRMLREIDLGDLLPANRTSLHTTGNSGEVVVICENGKIFRLDLIAGELTGEINLFSADSTSSLNTYVELLKSPDFYVYSELVEEENLMLLCLHVGTGWNDAWFLDLDSFSLRCKVPSYYDYSAATGKIIVANYPDRGIFPYYSTDELVAKANAYLGEPDVH